MVQHLPGPSVSSQPGAPLTLRVRGYTDQFNERWVGVHGQSCRGYVRLQDLGDTRYAWAGDLTHQGVTVITSATRASILREAERASFTRPLLAVDRYGWVGGRYFWPGDTVPPRLGGDPAVDARAGLDAAPPLSGCFADWELGVRGLIEGQSLPIFALSCAFAGLLLPLVPGTVENPGFEICGPSSNGKTTLLRLMASVYGGPEALRTWLTTANALEDAAARCGGALLLDEVGLFVSSGDRNGARDYRNAIMRLAEGSPKRRLGEAAGLPHRFVFVSSTNTAVTDLLVGVAPDEAAATAARLVTVQADAGAGLGVFSHLPEGVDSAAAAAAALATLAARDHGWAGRRFVRRLEHLLGAPGGRAALLRMVERRMSRFRRQAHKGEPLAGVEARVLAKFALVAAAGRLAQRWGALPVNGVEQAVLAVYARRCQFPVPAAGPQFASERVAAYVQRHRAALHDLRRARYPSLTSAQLDAAPGFVTEKAGATWLLVRKARWATEFGAEAAGLLHRLKRAGLLWTREGLQTQERVRLSHTKDRVYRIRIDVNNNLYQ
ncbi:DUF927 domain-containing protein [Lichenibacterium minor]|uniref:DUF927 domain-containing protein n=1 Tax=Lichenibacterium minor TaxID=2316528 RepID=A0A4Q2U8D8_9HYPH|nr:DUF927 domain-containing protein [Lichenibacterium minor]RYC31145.1 DUF927 domain-containing protein [Lichenibacterium minor]